jgi:hypothetical protein
MSTDRRRPSVTKAADEIAKAAERGLELTAEEVELEEAREAFHKDRRNKAAREGFKAANRRVARIRHAKRLVREAEGPPPGVNVKRDGTGRVMGWEDKGDAVAAPGGMEG